MPNRQQSDSFVRLGLQLLADQKRQKDLMAERESERDRIKHEETVGKLLNEGIRSPKQEMKEEEFGMKRKRFSWEEEDREREEEDRKKKEDFERLKKEWNVVEALRDTGNEREAAARLSKMYNKKYPDGNEIGIVFREDAFSNPEVRKLWQSNPGMNDYDVAVFSKEDGLLPMKTMDDLMKYFSANLSYDKYLEDTKINEQRLAQFNDKQVPYLNKDGNMVIDTYVLGPGGITIQGPTVPYKGTVRASEGKVKTVEAEQGLGRRLTEEEKKPFYGIRPPGKETPSKGETTIKELTKRGIKLTPSEQKQAHGIRPDLESKKLDATTKKEKKELEKQRVSDLKDLAKLDMQISKEIDVQLQEEGFDEYATAQDASESREAYESRKAARKKELKEKFLRNNPSVKQLYDELSSRLDKSELRRFNSPEEVKEAVRRGELTLAEGKKIVAKQFGGMFKQ